MAGLNARLSGLKNSSLDASNANVRRSPIFKLFKRILEIIKQSVRFTDDELDAFNDQLLESAARLMNVVHRDSQKRVFLENFPERKIVVRTVPVANNHGRDDALSDATVEFFGGFHSFGFQVPQGGSIPWPQFAAVIEQEDVARCWTDTIQMLVSAAVRGDFRDNRQNHRKRIVRS